MHTTAKIIPPITDASRPNPISHHSVLLSDSQTKWNRELAMKGERGKGGERKQDTTGLKTPLVSNNHVQRRELESS